MPMFPNFVTVTLPGIPPTMSFHVWPLHLIVLICNITVCLEPPWTDDSNVYKQSSLIFGENIIYKEVTVVHT